MIMRKKMGNTAGSSIKASSLTLLTCLKDPEKNIVIVQILT